MRLEVGERLSCPGAPLSPGLMHHFWSRVGSGAPLGRGYVSRKAGISQMYPAEPQGKICCDVGREHRRSRTRATVASVTACKTTGSLTPAPLFSVLSGVMVWPLTKSRFRGLSNFLVLSVLQSAGVSAPKMYLQFVFFLVSPLP